SKATVSRVLNQTGQVKQATTEKVYQAMAELGYQPNSLARALASNSSNSLGLVVSAFEGAYFSSLMSQTAEAASQAGKQLFIMDGGHSNRSETKAIENLVERKVDAIILYTRKLSENELIELMRVLPVPLVVINQKVTGFEDRSLFFDQYGAGRKAAKHLLDHQHKHIACIRGPQDSANSTYRLNGFLDTLAKHNIEVAHIAEGDYFLAGGYQACKSLLDNNVNFTALFTANDNMAIGAIRAIHESGLSVPHDISVIGFDNDPVGEFTVPSLTSVMLPINEVASHAVKQALQLIEQLPCSPLQDTSGTLIVRESVDQPKKPT
ncbi:LacI family DNA-binding transcriptional regulator, partial [Photobacterium sanctipauli]